MIDNERLHRVVQLVTAYVRSPSLRHIRDPQFIEELGRAIVTEVCSYNPVWTKWTKEREALARAAANCWLPAEDFRDFLNRLPGPQLTKTDVVERLRALNEEPYESYPAEDQRDACLEIYKREQSEGTDMPAIIGALQSFVEEDRERQHIARQEAYRMGQAEQREAAEARLRSGADCKWTALGSAKVVYCRVNGRLYRLEPQADKRLQLVRVGGLEAVKGETIGVYGTRGDATKVVRELAYKLEPHWH